MPNAILYEYNSTFVISSQTGDYPWVNLLNEAINSFLANNGIDTRNLRRAYIVKDNYVVVQKYGPLHGESLQVFLTNFLKEHYSNVEVLDLPRNLITELSGYVPTVGANGMLFGPSHPTNEHLSPSLPDKGIRPFCDVLNSFEDIMTVASCEGHDPDSRGLVTAFITFHAKSMSALLAAIELIERTYKDITDRLKLSVNIRLMLNYDFYHHGSIAFTANFSYPVASKETFYKSQIELVDTVIKHN